MSIEMLHFDDLVAVTAVKPSNTFHPNFHLFIYVYVYFSSLPLADDRSKAPKQAEIYNKQKKNHNFRWSNRCISKKKKESNTSAVHTHMQTIPSRLRYDDEPHPTPTKRLHAHTHGHARRIDTRLGDKCCSFRFLDI